MLTTFKAIENITPGTPYQVHETGWGEFEIQIKLYYVPESNEKPQTLYHFLRLHSYGSDSDKAQMAASGRVISWVYEEQLFNEPYEQFYEVLTNPVERTKGGKGKGTKVMRGGMVGSTGDRTSSIPARRREDQPFSRESERDEIRKLAEAKGKVDEMVREAQRDLRDKEEELKELRK